MLDGMCELGAYVDAIKQRAWAYTDEPLFGKRVELVYCQYCVTINGCFCVVLGWYAKQSASTGRMVRNPVVACSVVEHKNMDWR